MKWTSFCFIFGLFKPTNKTIFTTNLCEKVSILYLVMDLIPRTLEHESFPTTTRPGLFRWEMFLWVVDGATETFIPSATSGFRSIIFRRCKNAIFPCHSSKNVLQKCECSLMSRILAKMIFILPNLISRCILHLTLVQKMLYSRKRLLEMVWNVLWQKDFDKYY